ncbi:MAG TPA: adenosine kinase [Prolixibacteraceae bacterium]|nr:adenosine kinase [Prolixibacteraceae bacterium]
MKSLNSTTNGQKSVLGIGNALIDVLINITDDTVLQKFGLPKGSMTLVDAILSAEIKKETKNNHRTIQTGGSAANTVHGIAKLGGQCGYIGKISDDEMGNFFLEDFKRNQINTHFFYSETGTGHATGLISPDSERTFGTYLGAAMELTAEEMTSEIFCNYGIMHIEGYLVQNHALIEAAMKAAKANGLLVSIDMASFNIVEANLDFLHRIIRDYVDIVFANEEESYALTGKNPEEACSVIAGMCNIAIVKLGAMGSIIQSDKWVVRIDAISAKSIDTTGAGDIYAAGFLYALSEGLDLEIAGEIGSLLAGNVVEIMGAKIPEETWERLRPLIETIKQG